MPAHPEPTFECLELWQRQFSPNAAVAGWSLHGSRPSTRRRPGIFCRPRSRWFGVLGRRHGLKPTTWALHLAPGVVWHPESDVLASPGTEGLPSKPGGRPRQNPSALQTPATHPVRGLKRASGKSTTLLQTPALYQNASDRWESPSIRSALRFIHPHRHQIYECHLTNGTK